MVKRRTAKVRRSSSTTVARKQPCFNYLYGCGLSAFVKVRCHLIWSDLQLVVQALIHWSCYVTLNVQFIWLYITILNYILGPCLNQCLMDYTGYLFCQKETFCLGSILAELFIAISSAKTCSKSHIIIISSETTNKHNWPSKRPRQLS